MLNTSRIGNRKATIIYHVLQTTYGKSLTS